MIVDYTMADCGNCAWCGIYCTHNTRVMGFCPRCVLEMKTRTMEVINGVKIYGV